MVTMTAAEFNRTPSAVRRQVLTSREPVLVADRKRPSLVVMAYNDYISLTTPPPADPAAWLRMDADIDFDPAPVNIGLRVPEL